MTQPDFLQSSGIIDLDVANIELTLSSQYLDFVLCWHAFNPTYADINLNEINIIDKKIDIQSYLHRLFARASFFCF